MNEHDHLYEKLRESFENGELKDPILCKAFRETKPEPAPQLEAALRIAEGRLSACEEQMRATIAHRLRDAQSHADGLEALRREHSHEIHARDLRISELEHEQPEFRRVTFEVGEREALDAHGWVKECRRSN